ncbi:hypothetical protein ACU686_13595 [Yinghuangia aomiensis]
MQAKTSSNASSWRRRWTRWPTRSPPASAPTRRPSPTSPCSRPPPNGSVPHSPRCSSRRRSPSPRRRSASAHTAHHHPGARRGGVAVAPGNAASGQPLAALTDCLITLRERGFRAVRFRGCDALSKAELAWLCNAARRIFAESGARLGLVVDATVTGSGPGATVYYVRVTFSTKGILVLRLVGTRPAAARRRRR